ncbi:MAG: ectonucleotide pyrophosphatase/phosphodiesterase [Chitinophagaceae bacterium]
MKNYHTLFLFICLIAAGGAHSQADTAQHIMPGRRNSAVQQQKPYVILISADGFRYDYAAKYQPQQLLALGREGVQAEAMIPSFPSVTFPNHYTIATGLYPSHHGLVNNTFYDPAKKETYSMGARAKVGDSSWYGGTPLWVLAEQQQMLSASLFWVGSEAAVKGIRPTYYYNFNDKMPVAERIQVVRSWLELPEEKRPHIITFYLSEPDHAGHSYGPDDAHTQEAVQRVDSIIGALTKAVRATGLPVNFIFTSDHGMTAVDTEHPLALPAAIDTAKFIIPSSGTMAVLHARNQADIQPLYDQLKAGEKDYTVYLKTDMPGYLHYSQADDRFGRIGDILLLPVWPRVFSRRKPGIGHHGFDPAAVRDMKASFMAWGPAFKSNQRIPAFENVHVYPLIAAILGLQITEQIDGRVEVLRPVLK